MQTQTLQYAAVLNACTQNVLAHKIVSHSFLFVNRCYCMGELCNGSPAGASFNLALLAASVAAAVAAAKMA